jgi:predicted extracellular nuclease
MYNLSRHIYYTICLFVIIILICCKSDKNISINNQELFYIPQSKTYYRIMSYNTENFYDTFHDTLKNDFDFLPQGKYKWNYTKYKEKINHISKVIIGLGEWNPPILAALVEVENRHCIEDLVNNAGIAKINYGFIHEESPDSRGIDVALLYRKNIFTPIYHRAIRVNFPDNPEKKTRDILFVKGMIDRRDTLNVFVNHWPSRLGGEIESEPLRNYIATVLKKLIDSVFYTNPKAYIVILGDFNDEPDNSSIKNVLKARITFDTIQDKELYNLSFNLIKKGEGSYKYKGQWSIIDQIIVSGSFLSGNNSLYIGSDDTHIFHPSFLLEKDKSNVGFKPKRTYNGFKYNGGFSDHLPVYIDINIR